MARSIHATAIIHPDAKIGENVTVGPYCVIGEDVTLGDGCLLHSHVVLAGRTRIGANNRFFPFASIGHEPQDLKFHGEPSVVTIGDGNTFRESVTVNPGTAGGGMLTSIGNNNLLMAYVHIAHDCHVGNGTVLANNATLAGHVTVQDQAIIGGLTAIHQFLRIGQMAMVGGMSGIVKDVPPYSLTAGGYRPSLSGLNLIGLKRGGFDQAAIGRLKQLYELLLKRSPRPLAERLAEADQLAANDVAAAELVSFVRTAKRGLTQHGTDENS